MSLDRVVGQLIAKVRNQSQNLKDDLSSLVAQDLYSVGKLQGRIQGLEESLIMLEEIINESAEN